jgi:heterotetrameric sarcosine oxidase delta subunit
MFIIECPWCGKRDQTEFTAHGEAHIARPENPAALTEDQWGDYVFFRSNKKGNHYERWVHTHGCRRWFNVVRNTLTDQIHHSYKPGDPRPEVE